MSLAEELLVQAGHVEVDGVGKGAGYPAAALDDRCEPVRVADGVQMALPGLLVETESPSSTPAREHSWPGQGHNKTTAPHPGFSPISRA